MKTTDSQKATLTSTHWGTYRVHTEAGRVKRLSGFEEDRDPSPIGQGIVDVLDGPLRIRRPMVRRGWLEQGPGGADGARGRDEFVEVSWDKAIGLVAGELDRVRSQYGNEAIYGGSYGWSSAGRFHHAQGQLRRFLNLIGGCTASVNTYSYAAAEVTLPHVLGGFTPFITGATSWDVISRHTELFVAFGGVPVKNGQVTSGGVGRHVQRAGVRQAAGCGVEFVNVSPLRSDMPDEAGAQWCPIRPGSDVALLLGIAHTLHEEGLADQAFLERYTVGFDRVLPYLTGAVDGVPKTAAWAAEQTELPAERIRALARDMAAKRTMISVSWSLTRQDNGEQPYWAAITVAAMLGQIGTPGGGIGFGYSAINAIGDCYRGIPSAALPQGRNPVGRFIPVARIADMLLHPGERFQYNGMTGVYPDIRLIYWVGGNPFHHHQDLVRLRRAWQRPDTIIVNEWCWNPQARHADIVLPVNTFLERSDFAASSRESYLIYMEQAIESVGESRSDFAIFADLADALGVREAFTEGRDESAWLAHLYGETRRRAAINGVQLPELEELRARGWFRTEVPDQPRILLRAFRDDPDAHPLKTPSGRIELYSETVAGFGYWECPGHAYWKEPAEWLGADNQPYPLHLISNQPATKLHSQLDHGSHSRSGKVNGREPVRIHPDDAAARELRDGDLVRLFNDRGSCLCTVVISDAVRPGVVQVSTGAWYDPPADDSLDISCLHGNPNVLTPDHGTSRLAQGPSALSCLVEVEACPGEPPAVAAFTPPPVRQA
ncbi:MAG: molybdopterin guanine dinucleotide-containing S/N-oxide reductase [Ectothiorhodospiraceae bacterium]|nr:molybdopterin guanine dinucleotide-containing S/N-oxide reductase [Ectothiorhodospiraceae bacterium]